MTDANPPRADIEEQRRRDIENYRKYGAIKKRLHALPEYERDLKGTKLPRHGLPSTSSGDVEPGYQNISKMCKERLACSDKFLHSQQGLNIRFLKSKDDWID